MMLGLPRRATLALMLILVISPNLAIFSIQTASALPTWPSSWIEIDWDRAEDGSTDDWRDVEYAYYQYDASYLYLKLQCYDLPGKDWLAGNARYKWFVDTDGTMIYSGGNIYNAEHLLFVEDTNHDGSGEMYLVHDVNNDNNFGEYEPWPPTNYADYKITDPNIGNWRIIAPNQIEMCIEWASIGDPPSYGLFWATDQENPNLDQGPTSDRVDEEQTIVVHNVAAISQTPNPATVSQGEQVTIEIVVENKGTQIETFNVTCYFNNTITGTQLVSGLAAARQTTLIFHWNTSSLPLGNYTITAWADSNAVITETNESDNWCTSPALVTILPVPVHDVAAISQIPDRTSAAKGSIVNINVTVANLGDLAETFNLTCYYGSNVIDCQTVTNLTPKASFSMIFEWNTTDVSPSMYYIRAMADSSRNIVETDESNNNCTSFEAVTVYSSGDMGKLFVDKVKTAVISGADPPIVALPTVYELTVIVANIGGSSVTDVKVNETISSDAVFISVGIPSQGSVSTLLLPKIVWNVGTLSSGANATLTLRISVTPTSPDLININHKEDIVTSGIDSLSNSTVSDTGDTSIEVIAIMRDIAAISQVPSSMIVTKGETVAIYVVVKNLGNVSETFDVACYYDSNLIGVARVYNLLEGDQATIPFAWDTTTIPPGMYSITAEADSSFEISESNEENNLCTTPSTIEIIVHDVAIISQNPSPTTVTQGEIVVIEVVVKNEGTVPETFNVSCYYNETFLEIKTVTNLIPNATLSVDFIWNTTGISAGIYFINAQAIPVLDEQETDNNACLSTTTVTIASQQYYLTVSSPYGATGGEGLYDSGSTIYATLNTGLIEYGNGTRRLFVYWSGDASGTNYAQSDPILIDGPKHAIAIWKTQHFLTVNVDPPGIATISGEGWYDATTNVPLTAPTVTNYNFLNWETDGIPHGAGVVTVSVGMNAPHTSIAYYEREGVVGGATIMVSSSILVAWIGTNIMLIAAIFIAVSWLKRRK